jgi:transglutaminase-like putative cysteine protease
LATRSFGNYQARIVFPDKIKELTVEVEVIAKLQVINPFDYFVEEYAEEFYIRPNASARIDCLSKFKRRKSYFPKIHGGSKTNQYPLMILVSINQAVYKELSYNLRMEVGANTRRNFTYQEWILQRFCMAIDSRFTPLWISSTICIWLYCTIISRR